MIYDRAQMKEGAKHRLRQDGVPTYKLVTLIYLLLVSLLPSLVNGIVGTPTITLNSQIISAYENMDLDLVNDLMAQYATSNAGMVAVGCSILMALFTAVVTVGYQFNMLKMARNQRTEMDDLSYGLNFVGKIILVTVLEYIYIFLWSFLFVIPGIIAAYRYRLAMYALIDDPSISASEAIRRSKILTMGRKGKLFVMDLSFLGWMLLVSLCSIIGESIGEWLFGTTTVTATVISTLLSFAASLPLGLWYTAYRQLAETYFYEYARISLTQGQAPGGPGQPFNPRDDDWQNQPPHNDGNNNWNQPPRNDRNNGWNQPPQNDGWNHTDDPWN